MYKLIVEVGTLSLTGQTFKKAKLTRRRKYGFEETEKV
jgi:hypothetical protein